MKKREIPPEFKIHSCDVCEMDDKTQPMVYIIRKDNVYFFCIACYLGTTLSDSELIDMAIEEKLFRMIRERRKK